MNIIFAKQNSNTIVFRTPLLVPKFYTTVDDYVESDLPLPFVLHKSIIQALQCSPCVKLLPEKMFDKEFEKEPVMCLEATDEEA